jgi:acyl dehydratase
MGTRVLVGGPYFEDLDVGRVFDAAPALTLTEALASWHQAITGDRLRLPLEAPLCAAVTGEPRPLAHPVLVANVAIGQSTEPSQRVIGNLFYRGLVASRPVHLGDTLRTRTEVVASRQNRPKPGRPAAGTVVLRVTTENQRGETVLDFWRAPMVPMRDQGIDTGRADDLAAVGADVDLAATIAVAPRQWDLGALRSSGRGPHADDLKPGTVLDVEARDTVTCAPEYARLTLNLARTHTDAGAGTYGRRLVFGGHTIALAFALCLRALPDIATILAWRGCDHNGPVFEEDILSAAIAVDDVHPLDAGAAVDLHVRVFADRGPHAAEDVDGGEVLDWRLSVLMP